MGVEIVPDQKPPLDYNRTTTGWANTGRIRIRPGWFGFVVAEELFVKWDGGGEWRRLSLPKIIIEGRKFDED